MRRGFKAQSERKAIALRRELALSLTDACPARDVAQHLRIPVIQPQDVTGFPAAAVSDLRRSESWSAVTVHREEDRLIIFNPWHSAQRQESDIMHELAHHLCGHKATPIVRGQPYVRTCNGDVENEATWLGACIQVPRDGLLELVRSGLDNARIAAHYGASLELVRWRRQTTGVDFQVKRSRKRA